MTRTFVRLKLRLIVNGTRKTSQAIGLALAVVFGLVGAVALFAVLAAARGAGAGGDLAVVATGVVFFGWVLASVFIVGVDESVDVRRLSLLPLSRRQLYTGLVAAGLVGVGPVSAALGLSGLVAGYAPYSPAALLVVSAVVVAVVMPMTASRALATFLAGSLRHRWLKDLAVVLGAAVPMAGYLVPTMLGSTVLDPVDGGAGAGAGALTAAAGFLRYTPGGLTGNVAASAAAGDHLVSVASLAGAFVWTAVFAWAWAASVNRLVDEPELASVGRRRAGRAAGGAFGWPSPTPAGAVRARELHYLLRAPNRRAVLVTFPLIVAALAGSQLAFGDISGVYSAVGVLVFLSASQLSNQFGFHSGALWVEAVAAASPRDLVVGRQAAWYLTAIAPVLVLLPLIGFFTGDWGPATMLVVSYLAVTPVLVAAGSVASVTAAYAVPEDSNPFRNNQVSMGQGCVAGVVSLVVTLVALLATAPAIALVVWAARTSFALGLASLLPLAVYSWGVRTLFVAYAARRLAARRGELIERLCLARS